MSIFSVVKNIVRHPLAGQKKVNAISRFLRWQIGTRLNPYPIIYPFTEKTKLIIQRGMTGATGNLYCGLHEFHDMAFLLHFLREKDCFVDIGSNIGSYTILASGECHATTYVFEPSPHTFNCLTSNILINNLSDKVKAFNLALGEETGFIGFTTSLDTANHAVIEESENLIRVPISTLDGIMDEKKVSLIKIDVEGFEMNVIKGGTKTLSQDDLKAIIIELNGSGRRYGYEDIDIHRAIADFGFKPFEYNALTREIISLDSYNQKADNTIYIRDTDFVLKRIKTAGQMKVLDILI